MKKILLLFISATLLLTSCSSNDDLDINITSEDLLGTWNLVKLEADLTTSTTFNGTTVKGDTELYGKEFDFTFNFTSSPNEYTSEGNFIIVTKTSFGGQTQVLETPTTAVPSLSSGDWLLKGNKLIFNESTQAVELTIRSFEANRIVLKQVINESQSQSGTSVKIKGDLIIVLEK
ncbi:Lipocalin-like protein [Tenacibaculum sp. 190130A14a]|uniref:Lipocalin-like protein n=1 Tax=Tenacibaculum polynesiense TaxID=3137857 RepID=A0ABP1EY92_9FLAO